MSAEVLREAARLMRERADKATPGPWEVSPQDATRPWRFDSVVSTEGWRVVSRAETFDPERVHNAPHIASWPPAVALAVADWLDATAVTMQQVTDDLRGLEGAPTVEQVYGYDFTAALAVARAYLGEAS